MFIGTLEMIFIEKWWIGLSLLLLAGFFLIGEEIRKYKQ